MRGAGSWGASMVFLPCIATMNFGSSVASPHLNYNVHAAIRTPHSAILQRLGCLRYLSSVAIVSSIVYLRNSSIGWFNASSATSAA